MYDGAATCEKEETRAACNARLGGLFDEGSSSTWDAYANYTAPGFAAISNTNEASNNPAESSGTDVFKISDQLSLDNFAFGIDHAGGIASNGGLNPLGLGSNSSLLRDLEKKGAINSQTWSIWQGWNGAQASQQMDGNLVLGGYDEAKFTGANVTQPIQYDQSCLSGLIITVTDITMNLKNGSSPSILGTSHGSALRACIHPEVTFVTLPSDIWSGFVNVSGSTEVGRSESHVDFFSQLVLTDGA